MRKHSPTQSAVSFQDLRRLELHVVVLGILTLRLLVCHFHPNAQTEGNMSSGIVSILQRHLTESVDELFDGSKYTVRMNVKELASL